MKKIYFLFFFHIIFSQTIAMNISALELYGDCISDDPKKFQSVQKLSPILDSIRSDTTQNEEALPVLQKFLSDYTKNKEVEELSTDHSNQHNSQEEDLDAFQEFFSFTSLNIEKLIGEGNKKKERAEALWALVQYVNDRL